METFASEAGTGTITELKRLIRMKVGILTFHYTTNQGSIMQAYSLYHFLKENIENVDVKIIDLIPTYRELHELLFLKKRFPYISRYKFLKYIRHRRFVRNSFERTKRFYSNNLQKQIDFVNQQDFDYIITGSDTVWFKNSKLKNLIPNIYFLPDGIKAKRISYAVSVDPLNDENFYTGRRDEIKKALEKFVLLTVRDQVTFELLNKLGIEKAIKVIDPTLLYSFEKKLNLKISDRRVEKIEKIGLGIIDKKLAQKIKILLTDYGYKVFDFFNESNLKTDFLIDELNLYHQFDCVITDRFHRTIFTLKLCKGLVIYVENTNFNKKRNSKGRDLLERIGIDENIVNSSEDNFEELILNKIQEFNSSKQINQNNKLHNFIRSQTGEIKKLMRNAMDLS